MPEKEYINMLFILPVDLHRRFKVRLAQEDRTAKEFFITCVQIYVNEGDHAKKDKPKKRG